MRFLQIIPYPVHPITNGGHKYIATFGDYLSKKVPLTSYVVNGGKFRYMNPLIIPKLLKVIRINNITHIIVEHCYMGWVGIVLKRLTGVKLIVKSHNIESQRWKSLKKWWWRILYHYEKRILKLSDYSSFICDYDMNFAINNYGIDKAKSFVVRYGVEINKFPTKETKHDCREVLRKMYSIPENHKIFLFNGQMNYKPNKDGLIDIMSRVNNILLRFPSFKYKIIICGGGLDKEVFNEYQSNLNVYYAGYVKDIETHYKGADFFINPVIAGGGVKTKLIEALSNNTPCISYVSGARGISQASVVRDKDHTAFALYMMNLPNHEINESAFFKNYYWKNIIKEFVKQFTI